MPESVGPEPVLELTTEEVDRRVETLRDDLSSERVSIPTAADTIATLAATFDTSRLFEATAASLRAVRETQLTYYSNLAAILQEQIVTAIRPAALIVAQQFTEQMSSIAAAFAQSWPQADWERYEKALWRMGWSVPPSLPMRTLWRLGQDAAARQRLAVRRTMLSIARSPAMFDWVEDWSTVDAFARRKRFILDGLRDHRAGRYRVSVPTLLPHIEGIAFEVFAPEVPNDRSLGTMMRERVPGWESALGEALVETVLLLWRRKHFSELLPTSRELNRHHVLHGWNIAYGTEVNSAKAILAFDLLAAVVKSGRRAAAA